jgi:GDP-fucose transporter C1
MSGDLELDAPLFMTWTQIVFAVIGCYVISLAKSTFPGLGFFPKFEYKPEIAKGIMPLTIVFIGMIVFNNLCLKYVEVSFYQVARSLTIVFNVVFSWFLLQEKISKAVLTTVGVVVAGYLIGCDGEVNFSWIGVIFGISASLCVALYAISVKKALKLVKEDSWLLMIYSNMNAMIAMPIIIIFAGEIPEIRATTAFAMSSFWVVVTATGVFGFLINIATFLQIQYTSPLTHNVSGTAKSGFQTLLAFKIWGNPITTMSILGNILVLVGSFLYAYVRNAEKAKPKAPAAYEKVNSNEQDLEAVPTKNEHEKSPENIPESDDKLA